MSVIRASRIRARVLRWETVLIRYINYSVDYDSISIPYNTFNTAYRRARSNVLVQRVPVFPDKNAFE